MKSLYTWVFKERADNWGLAMTATVRLMAVATLSLSVMRAVEGASRAAPPATPEHEVVENYHRKQVRDPYRWLEQARAPAVERWVDTRNAYPTILSAYGHQGRVLQPSFIAPVLAWLERGGVYACAKIRGGGEVTARSPGPGGSARRSSCGCRG
jgi:hypothetical protein